MSWHTETIVEPPPPDLDDEEGGDEPELSVWAMIRNDETDLTWSTRIGMPTSITGEPLACALISAMRGAAAAHSMTLSSALDAALAGLGGANATSPNYRLTVSTLDEAAVPTLKVSGQPPETFLLQIPGWPTRVPYPLVRAILAAAGAW